MTHHLGQEDMLNPVSNHFYHLALSEQNAHTTVAVKTEQTINSHLAPFHAEGPKHLQNKVNYLSFYRHENQRVVISL